MQGPGDNDHFNIILKCNMAEEDWKRVVRKVEVWKTQISAFQAQLKQMKSGLQRLGFFPTPLPFAMSNPSDRNVSSTQVDFTQCYFCCRGFEPTWDCKLACCRHGYHSTRCVLPSCDAEMHWDWWELVGIPNPTDVGVELSLWIADAHDGPAAASKGMCFLVPHSHLYACMLIHY
jgi:hypothetical protein